MKRVLQSAALIALLAASAISDVPDRTAEFTFARAQFNMTLEGVFYRGEVPWHHDHPFSERFLTGMLRSVSSLHTSEEAYRILQLDSPEILRFPFLYIAEPGYMDMTEAEAANLRDYLSRGGFVMFDDFRGVDLQHLRNQMKLVFPDRDMFRLDLRHPIFNSFYQIESLEMEPPYFDDRFTGPPEFWGMNDDDGNLMLVANQNNDFGEFWEWLDQGDRPLTDSATTVRLGVNYVIYAMTH